MINIMDGARKKIQCYSVSLDGVSYKIKRIHTYRPAHITTSSKADWHTEFEIIREISNQERSDIIKEIQKIEKKGDE